MDVARMPARLALLVTVGGISPMPTERPAIVFFRDFFFARFTHELIDDRPSTGRNIRRFLPIHMLCTSSFIPFATCRFLAPQLPLLRHSPHRRLT